MAAAGMTRQDRGKTGADMGAPRTRVLAGCMNLKYIQVFLFLIFPIVLTSCVATSTQLRFEPVPAGALFEGPYINIHAPNSDGWYLTGSSSLGMEFSRKGNLTNQTFGAQVLRFPWRGDRNTEELLLLAREAFEEDWQLERYENIEREFYPSEERDYPCVRIKYVTKDKFSLTSDNEREVLILQASALYCLHPDPYLEGTGFAIIYSHRGSSLHSNFGDEAQDFIDGVQVPEKHS